MENELDVVITTTQAIAKDSYGDLIKPSAKAIGDAAAGPIKLLSVPFQLMGHAADLFRKLGEQLLDEKLKHVPPEDRIPPKTNVAMPLLQGVVYNIDEEVLRNQFLNLLANAMSKNDAINVHNAFPTILQQMSATDALLFNEIYHGEIFRHKSLLIGTIRVSLKEPHGGFIEIAKNLALPNCCKDITQVALSLDNLERLSIIKNQYDRMSGPPDIYSDLESHPLFKATQQRYSEPNLVSLKKGCACLTELGKQFGKVVLQPPLRRNIIPAAEAPLETT